MSADTYMTGDLASALRPDHEADVDTVSTGTAYPRVQIAAALVLGSIALLIVGLQPQLLGALAASGRLSEAQVGIAATAELLTLGLATALAASFFPARANAALIGCLAAIAQGLVTLASAELSGVAFIGARIGTGCAEGVMLWVTVSLITRTRHPDRWSGVFLVVQTSLQLLVAMLFSLYVLPRLGVERTWLILAGLALVAALAALLTPRRYPALPRSPDGGKLAPGHFLALVAVALYMAFIVTVWVYLHPLALAAGLPASVPENAVALGLGAQVLGGALATAVSSRLHMRPTLTLVALANLAILVVLGLHPDGIVFTAAIIAFGALWLFIMPFQVLFLILVDSSRRTALALPTAQLAGSSFGPLLAAAVVGEDRLGNVLWLAGGFLVTGSVLMLALIRHHLTTR